MRLLCIILLLVTVFSYPVFSFKVQINTNLKGVDYKDGIVYIYTQPSEVLYLDRLFTIERTGEITLDPRPPINYVFIIDTSKDSRALKYVKKNIDQIISKLDEVGSITKYAVIGVSNDPVLYTNNYVKSSDIKKTILSISENVKWDKHYISLEKAITLSKDIPGGTPSGYHVILIFVDKGPINWNILLSCLAGAGKVYILYFSDTNRDSMNTISSYAIMSKYANVYNHKNPNWLKHVTNDLSKSAFKRSYLLESKYLVPYGKEVSVRGHEFSFKHDKLVGSVGILFKAPPSIGEYPEEICIIQKDTNLKKCFKVHYIVGKLVEAKVDIYPHHIRDDLTTYVSVILHNKLPKSETVRVEFSAEVNNKEICKDIKYVYIEDGKRKPILFECYIPEYPFSFVVEYKIKMDNGLEYTVRKFVKKKTAEVMSKAYLLYTPYVLPEQFSYVVSTYNLEERKAIDSITKIVSYLRKYTRDITSSKAISDYAYWMLRLYTG